MNITKQRPGGGDLRENGDRYNDCAKGSLTFGLGKIAVLAGTVVEYSAY